MTVGKCTAACSSPSVASDKTCVNAKESALADLVLFPKKPISPKNESF